MPQRQDVHVHASHASDIFVSTRGRACSTDTLPDELLSYVFELGRKSLVDGDRKNEGGSEEEDVLYFWDDQMFHPIPISNLTRREDKEVDENDELEQTQHGEVRNESEVSMLPHDSHPSPSFRANISGVCRRWRNLVISIPSFWTTVVASPNKHSFEHVQTQLARSKDLPIDIHVDDGRDDHKPSVADLRTLYDLLVPHVYRWRSIVVDVSEYQHTYSFLDAISSPTISAAPLLTSLVMHDFAGTKTLNNDWDTRLPKQSRHFGALFGGSVPRLTNLALCRVGLRWDQPWIKSLSNLTTLELRNHRHDARPSWRQFASVLRGTPVLKKLTLYWSGAHVHPSDDLDLILAEMVDLHTPIELLHLTDLTFSEEPDNRIMELLRRLEVPALKNLTLEPEFYNEDDFIENLAELPASPASSSESESDDDDDDDEEEQFEDPDYAGGEPPRFLNRIEHLGLLSVVCAGGSEPLELLFDELRNLKSLQLSLPLQWYMTPAYLKLLLPKEDGEVRLPLLETLIIGSNSEKMIIPLRNVVQQRKSAGFPLKSLYLQKTCRRFDDEDLRWFKENSVTVSLFCLCLTKTSAASACWEHPKVEYGNPGRGSCNCCPPPSITQAVMSVM